MPRGINKRFDSIDIEIGGFRSMIKGLLEVLTRSFTTSNGNNHIIHKHKVQNFDILDAKRRIFLDLIVSSNTVENNY